MKRRRRSTRNCARRAIVAGDAAADCVARDLLDIFCATPYATIGGRRRPVRATRSTSPAPGAYPRRCSGRGHIRIDTVYVRVTRAARAALIAQPRLSRGIFGDPLFAWYGWGVLVALRPRLAHSQSAIEMPLSDRRVWFAGIAFFVAVSAFALARSIAALSERRSGRPVRLSGAKSRLRGEEGDQADGTPGRGENAGAQA